MFESQDPQLFKSTDWATMCPRASILSFVLSVFSIFLFILFQFPFLPRDAMHKRGYCRHAVSVRPSVCHVRGSYQNG